MHAELVKLQSLLQSAPEVLKSTTAVHQEEVANMRAQMTRLEGDNGALKGEVSDKGAPRHAACCAAVQDATRNCC